MWEDVANATPEYIAQSLAANIISYDWTVATNKTFKTSQAFFFDLYFSPADIGSGVNNEVAIGHYFNITTTTTSTSTSTSSTTSSTSYSSSTSSPSPSTGLSTGAKIGLGVGAAVVLIAILAICWFVFKKRKGRKDEEMPMTAYVPVEKGPPSPPYMEIQGPVELAESGGYKPARIAPSELDSGSKAATAPSELESSYVNEPVHERYELQGS